jgi:hypothetical protein
LINQQVALTARYFVLSFDLKSLFLIGTHSTYKWGSSEQDCFIIRASLNEPNLAGTGVNGRLSGAFLGTNYNNDVCLGLATNRYD